MGKGPRTALIIAVVLLVLLILGAGIVLTVRSVLFSAVGTPENDGLAETNYAGLLQYSEIAPEYKQRIAGGDRCAIESGLREHGVLFGKTAKIRTLGADYEIVTSDVSQVRSKENDRLKSSSGCGVVTYRTEVFRNGQPLDTISFPQPESCGDLLSSRVERDYGDLKAVFGATQGLRAGDLVYCGPRDFIVHEYNVVYPQDTVTFKVLDFHILPDNQSLNVTLEAKNQIPLKGIVGIDVVVPTVVGEQTSPQSANLDLPSGLQKVSFLIKLRALPDKLRIRPFTDLTRPTVGFSGVNGDLIFRDGITEQDISRHERLRIGRIESNDFILTLQNKTVQEDTSTALSEVVTIVDEPATTQQTVTDPSETLKAESSFSISELSPRLKLGIAIGALVLVLVAVATLIALGMRR